MLGAGLPIRILGRPGHLGPAAAPMVLTARKDVLNGSLTREGLVLRNVLQVGGTFDQYRHRSFHCTHQESPVESVTS